MKNLTTAALAILAIGIFSSVSILAGFQILFSISAVYYTYLAFKDKNLKLPKSSYWLLAFVVVAFISLVINFDVIPRPTKNFGRLKYYLFGVTGIFVFRYWLAEASDKVKKNVVSLFMIAIIIAAVFGIGKFFVTDQKRLRGFTDTLRYGYGTGMILLVIVSGILHREKIKNWFDYRIAIVALVTGFAALFLTYTRGALLGFFCGLPFVCFFYSRKLGLTLGGLSIGIVLTLGLFYLFGSGDYGSRFLVNKDTNSDRVRRSQWLAAGIAVKEKPVLGWGLSNFHSQLKRIKYDYDLDAKAYDDAHAHNLFLETAAGTGIVGLIIFIGWVFTWAMECFRSGGMVRALVVPMGAAWVISSQFEVTFDANNASMIFIIYSLSSCIGLMKKHA